MLNLHHHNDSVTWLREKLNGITDSRVITSVSEWAEEKRYLPPSVSPLPGTYSFDVSPYLREIADCLSINSSVREVAVRKGHQVGATVGVLENAIGYVIDHVKSAPCMLVTADAELAKIRIDQYIMPMLQHSGMSDLIMSSDEKNARKTGKTNKKIEWQGGGFLVPFGAINANKLRSISIQYLLRDEIDGWPLIVGKQGDPITLSGDRTSAYERTRKIVDLSTPLEKGTSKIDQRFMRGDQRYYYCRCLKCGFPQPLKFRGKNKKTGKPYGLVWEMENGQLVSGSVRYRCENCGHDHINDDKTRLMAYDNAEWRPTATPMLPTIRSYQLSALYAPPQFHSWESVALAWGEAWDDSANRVRDVGKLQTFYNNELGQSFEQVGQKLRFSTVSAHRRKEYRLGEVPNDFAVEHTGQPILLITMAVDVHKDNLAVKVMGWSPGRERGRAFVIDYWRFKGDCEDIDNPETWGRLRNLIDHKEYTADDGRQYRIAITMIDAGYNTDLVVSFCQEWETGVFPVLGRDRPSKSQTFSEFGLWTTRLGTRGFRITVDYYKDRWSTTLRKQWDGMSEQPEDFYNAPLDVEDKQLTELTVEHRKKVTDAATGRELGHKWVRPQGVNNEMWDLLMYNSAALDVLAWDYCINVLELEVVDWSEFWALYSE